MFLIIDFASTFEASLEIARKGLGFQEILPPVYQRVLAQVGDTIKPRLKPSIPSYEWVKIQGLFKHRGTTSFKTSEVLKMSMIMRNVLNSATSAQPDNLRAGLSR